MFQFLFCGKGNGNFAFALLRTGHLHLGTEHVRDAVSEFGVFFGQSFGGIFQRVSSAFQRFASVKRLDISSTCLTEYPFSLISL